MNKSEQSCQISSLCSNAGSKQLRHVLFSCADPLEANLQTGTEKGKIAVQRPLMGLISGSLPGSVAL